MEALANLITTNPVVFWLIVAIAAGVLEAVTVGLVSIWFSIGALAAMLDLGAGSGPMDHAFDLKPEYRQEAGR